MGETRSPSTARPATTTSSRSTLEAGIVLTGTEIKSIRAGKVNLQDAYARIERGEAWLIGAHIAPVRRAATATTTSRAATASCSSTASEIDQLLGRTEVEGPDARAAPAVHRRPRPGQGRARPGPRQAAPRPAPRHRRARRASATSSASWRTCAAAARRSARRPGGSAGARSRATIGWSGRGPGHMGMRGFDRAGSPENASRGAVRPR